MSLLTMLCFKGDVIYINLPAYKCHLDVFSKENGEVKELGVLKFDYNCLMVKTITQLGLLHIE